MEKALEILKACRDRGQKRAGGLDLDEAINELEEAMNPKTCDGCKYASYDDDCEEYYYSSDTYECRDCYGSGYKDNFMAKDNA